jgi:GH24 family phage-related lysozyme (muramidase)
MIQAILQALQSILAGPLTKTKGGALKGLSGAPTATSVDGGEDKYYNVGHLSVGDVELIKESEGLRLDAYLPTPNDVWTIGYGHTKTAKPGMKITQAGAEALLLHDLQWVETAIDTYVQVPLNQNQYDALASFIYNVGATAFRKSTMLKLLNKGDYEGAANQFPRWNKQKGKVLNGLTTRRQKEQTLFKK